MIGVGFHVEAGVATWLPPIVCALMFPLCGLRCSDLSFALALCFDVLVRGFLREFWVRGQRPDYLIYPSALSGASPGVAGAFVRAAGAAPSAPPTFV